MGNVTLHAIVSSVGSTGNFDAAKMWSAGSAGGNFNRLSNLINGQIDYENIKVSSILSQHINTAALRSVHFGVWAVQPHQVSQTSLLEQNMKYEASFGIRAVRVGSGGMHVCRVTLQYDGSIAGGAPAFIGSALTARLPFGGSSSGSYSNAKYTYTYTASAPDYASSPFAAAPILCAVPGIDIAGAGVWNYIQGYATNINATYADIKEVATVDFSGAIAHTIEAGFVGK